MTPVADRSELFLRYLDYFRETLAAKAAALPESERRSSRLLEYAGHLGHLDVVVELSGGPTGE